MPDKHVPDLVVVESVVQRKRDTAGITEDAIYAFLKEAIKENIRAGEEIVGHVVTCLPLNKRADRLGWQPRP